MRHAVKIGMACGLERDLSDLVTVNNWWRSMCVAIQHYLLDVWSMMRALCRSIAESSRDSLSNCFIVHLLVNC
jgi:hypothetical protein